MKSQLRIATMAVLTSVCLALGAVSASAQIKDLYDNGPIFGDIISPGDGGLTISTDHSTYGYAVSNSFGLTYDSRITGFQYGIWAYPGDQETSVDWTISSQKGGAGTVFGAGTATVGGNRLTGGAFNSTFLSSNAFGYDIDLETVSDLLIPLSASNGPTNYWLTLQNAQNLQGNPVFWDENSGGQYAGQACGGADGRGQFCPSSAEQYYTQGGIQDLGAMPSESFTMQGETPEPSSILLLGSGILGLGGVWRRRFLG